MSKPCINSNCDHWNNGWYDNCSLPLSEDRPCEIDAEKIEKYDELLAENTKMRELLEKATKQDWLKPSYKWGTWQENVWREITELLGRE